MTGTGHGKLLVEKRYGPGMRPAPTQHSSRLGPVCYLEGCSMPTYGSVELMVDDPPPRLDWYTRMLATLPLLTWVRVGFCQGHLADVTERSTDALDEPDQWAPWRESPMLFIRGGRVEKSTKPPTLIVPKDKGRVNSGG